MSDSEAFDFRMQDDLAIKCDDLILDKTELLGWIDRLELECGLVVRGDAAMVRIIQDMVVFRDTDIVRTFCGPPGTGKELFARAAHIIAGRNNAKLSIVNIASLVDGLLASELFGHEKGAFTGAIEKKAGRLGELGGGTLFLDEIGELDVTTQASLLRIIGDTHEFSPVGLSKAKPVDGNIVCATNRDLEEEVENRNFRRDLFERLQAGISMIPSFNGRNEDHKKYVVNHLIQKMATRLLAANIQIHDDIVGLLLEADIPGNVRGLSDVIQKSVAVAKAKLSSSLRPAHVKYVLNGASSSRMCGETDKSNPAGIIRIGKITIHLHDPDVLRKTEYAIMRHALEKMHTQSAAATLLGINRNTLHNKMEKYEASELNRPQFSNQLQQRRR